MENIPNCVVSYTNTSNQKMKFWTLDAVIPDWAWICMMLDTGIKRRFNLATFSALSSYIISIAVFSLLFFWFRQITNIDISQLVINQMISKNKTDRPDMQFLQMDACNMSFPKDKFSVVLDKGKFRCNAILRSVQWSWCRFQVSHFRDSSRLIVDEPWTTETIRFFKTSSYVQRQTFRVNIQN